MSLAPSALGGNGGQRAEMRRSGFRRAELWCVHGATVLVGVTGLVYGVMRYLLRPSDEFAVVNHPWQPTVQHLHVLLAPVLVFAAGLLWRAHVQPSLRHGVAARRRSGWIGLLAMAPMAASGYLLQVSVEPGWRVFWVAVHVATSLAWLTAYGLHQLGARLGDDTVSG